MRIWFSIAIISVSFSFGLSEISRKKRIARSVDSTVKPAVVVEFDPIFFENEKLRGLLSSLTGSKVKRENNKATDIIFRVKSDGRRFVRQGKRKRRVDEDDLASFHLNINPMLPRRPISLKNYTFYKDKQWCHEICMEHVTHCAHPDTPSPRSTTCFPTKPTVTKPLGQWCNLYVPQLPNSHVDPCACDQKVVSSTPYVHCKSSHYPEPCELVTHKWSTEKCFQPCRVEKCSTVYTHPPPTPPRCDLSRLSGDEIGSRPKEKFYVMLKRAAGIKPHRKSRLKRSKKTVYLVRQKNCGMKKRK